jgi:hypothetical protein
MRRMSRNGSRTARLKRTRVPNQRELLRDVLLSATQCESWLTLHELAQLTQYAEASISAQLRHLRKAKYGRYVVDKRLRRGIQVGAQRRWTSKALPSNAVAAMTAPSC